ncbi:MAG TPA: sulfatase [Thermoanaerobaculia bacterium]|jgi:arylsulfatase A-like enzyme
MRRIVLPLLLPSLLLLAAACGSGKARQESRPLAGAAKGWNVVLLTVDTLRADRLGAYGYKARADSPRIDAQLASGVTFDDAMSQRASTWPSLASLLTGLYPSAHGVNENGYGFPDGLPTLPLLLHAAGYRTGAFLSNMCQANHQGWDAFACSGGQDGKSVRRALDWARGMKGDRPFLLWVHLFGAHPPYYNGGDLADQLDPGYTGPLGPRKRLLDPVMTQPIGLTERDVRHLNALYDAAVQGSDHSIGALVEGLRAAGRLGRTIVVVAADHGEELYQHNHYLYHSCSVYQTALHVPLGISAPGLIAAGTRVPQTVELIDVLPTLLDLVGVAPPAEQHGKSLVPYLARPGAAGRGRPAFSEYGSSTVHTVLQDRWKLVHNPDGFAPVCIPDAPPNHYPIAREELYDLSRDPGETTNLAAREPARVQEMARLIQRRFAGLKNRVHQQDVPEDLQKELKSLGYVAH